MDEVTQQKADTVMEFLDWLLNQPHGHDDFAVGLWKGVSESDMNNWAPDHQALVYDYLGINLMTGEPINPA